MNDRAAADATVPLAAVAAHALARQHSMSTAVRVAVTHRELVAEDRFQQGLLKSQFVEQESRGPLFTRTKQLIHYIAFAVAIPAGQMIHKKSGEPRLGIKRLNHGSFVDGRLCGNP